MEMEPDRAETMAAKIAGAVGSWRFLVLLVLVIAGWLTANLVLKPFQPHPAAMVDWLGLALATIAALTGPLILLSQHRGAERDRARHREVLRVAASAEADLHAIRTALKDAEIRPASTEGA